MIKKGNQKLQIIALIVAIVGLGIGFAAFSNTLTISQSATVTPDSGNFKVVFTKTQGTEDTNAIVPTKSVNTLTATNGTIDSTNKLTLSNLGVTFTEPGQYVEYNLYVYNAGAYIAHLNSVTYRGSKSCTPADNTVNYVDEACNSISMTVKIGSTTTYTETTQNITGQSLNPGASTPVKIRIEYASNGVRADGPFTVSFPDVSLYYMTVSGTNEQYTPPYTLITDSSICSGHQAFQIGEENFCIMYEDSTTITGLAEKNITLSTTNPVQSDNAETLAFAADDASNTGYWWDSTNDTYASEYPLKSGDTYRYVYNSQSNLYTYVEAYKSTLTGLGANVQDARLASWEEVNAIRVANNNTMPSWMHSNNQSYWLGSASDGYYVCIVIFAGFLNSSGSYNDASNYGVRPVVTILKS